MQYLLIDFKMKLHNIKHKKTIVHLYSLLWYLDISFKRYYTIAYSLAYKARTQPLWGDIDDTYYGICSNTCMLKNPQRCKFCGSTFHFAAGKKTSIPFLLILGFRHSNMKDTFKVWIFKKLKPKSP